MYEGGQDHIRYVLEKLLTVVCTKSCIVMLRLNRLSFKISEFPFCIFICVIHLQVPE